MSGERSSDVPPAMSDDGRWMTYAELAEHRGISRPSAERLVLRKRWRRQRGNDRTVRILVPHDFLSGDISDDTSGDLSGDGSADISADRSGDTANHKAPFTGAITALEAALMEANKRADAALTLADRLSAQIAETGHRADRAEARAEAAESDRRRADELVANLAADLRAKDSELSVQRLAAELARGEAQEAQERAETLRAAIEELRGGQGLIAETHAAELAAAQDAARRAEEAAEALRQAEEARKARGRLRRAWDGWRGR